MRQAHGRARFHKLRKTRNTQKWMVMVIAKYPCRLVKITKYYWLFNLFFALVDKGPDTLRWAIISKDFYVVPEK